METKGLGSNIGKVSNNIIDTKTGILGIHKYIEEIITNTSETIYDKGNEMTVFSDRGGIIISIKIKGNELLYQDMYPETLLDSVKSVKGGIPYMFPNAGPLTNKEKENSGLDLPQHGIGRISKWERVNLDTDGEYIQEFNFSANENFPFQGKVTNTTKLVENGVEIYHNIENKGNDNMPLSTGLHPYFNIPKGKKSEIEWNFLGGNNIKKSLSTRANNGTISFDNPGIPFEVEIPGLGILILEASSQYSKFWVWSLKGKDFVCIEPVMENEGGIVNNPNIVMPGKINTNFMKIKLKDIIF